MDSYESTLAHPSLASRDRKNAWVDQPRGTEKTCGHRAPLGCCATCQYGARHADRIRGRGRCDRPRRSTRNDASSQRHRSDSPAQVVRHVRPCDSEERPIRPTMWPRAQGAASIHRLRRVRASRVDQQGLGAFDLGGMVRRSPHRASSVRLVGPEALSVSAGGREGRNPSRVAPHARGGNPGPAYDPLPISRFRPNNRRYLDLQDHGNVTASSGGHSRTHCHPRRRGGVR